MVCGSQKLSMSSLFVAGIHSCKFNIIIFLASHHHCFVHLRHCNSNFVLLCAIGTVGSHLQPSLTATIRPTLKTNKSLNCIFVLSTQPFWNLCWTKRIAGYHRTAILQCHFTQNQRNPESGSILLQFTQFRSKHVKCG